MKTFRIFSLLLVLVFNSTWAQGSDSLDWKITPYLWMVGIDGSASIGPIDQDIDISFSDILSDFEGMVQVRMANKVIIEGEDGIFICLLDDLA